MSSSSRNYNIWQVVAVSIITGLVAIVMTVATTGINVVSDVKLNRNDIEHLETSLQTMNNDIIDRLKRIEDRLNSMTEDGGS